MSESNEKCPEQVPRQQNIDFTMTLKQTKKQILTFKKLKPVSVWYFYFTK